MQRCPECNYPLVKGYALFVCESCKKHWSEEFMEGYIRGIEDTNEIIGLFAEKMRNGSI
jgi:predicted metal-binding protein